MSPDHEAFEAIEWAAGAGVTLGYGDGTFRPGLPMHRDHAVLFVERFYDDVLQAAQSPAFTRADMLLLLHAINVGTSPAATAATDTDAEWVFEIPPNPFWLERNRAVLAFFRGCCETSEDEEAMKQMWNELAGYGCDASVRGVCAGLAAGAMPAFSSARACPTGWSLLGAIWLDPQYDRMACYHPDHIGYISSRALYRSDVADPRGVRSDHWAAQTFSDVRPNHGAFEAIEWAAEAGVTLGYGDGTFRPGLPMHRDHAVLFVERFYDDVLQASQSPSFTRADMMRVLHAINNGSTFKAVAAGGLHSCGLRTDNTITCWGHNIYGQADAPSGSFKAVTAGGGHSCGLRTDDTIVCWGYNEDGQTDAPSGAFKAVSAGELHSCGLRTDDTITCWGDNTRWATPPPTPTGHTEAPEGSFHAVSVGTSHSCGLRTDDTITCWPPDGGLWEVVTLGSGHTDVPSGSFKAVTTGGYHSCGLRTDNTIVCWGYNNGGQTDAPSGTFKAVSAGEFHSCGLRSDNSVACWGYSGEGETDAPSGSFKAVSAGGYHSCGLHSDNSVTCWGSNWEGQANGPVARLQSGLP